jgi:ankyrin repeat protein
MFIEKTYLILIMYLIITFTCFAASGEMICKWKVVKEISETRRISKPICNCGKELKFNSLKISKVKINDLKKHCGEKFIIKEVYEPVVRNGVKMLRQSNSTVDGNLKEMLTYISSIKDYEKLEFFIKSQNYDLALLHWLFFMTKQRKFNEVFSFLTKLKIDKKYLKLNREILPQFWIGGRDKSREEGRSETKKMLTEQIQIYKNLGFDFNLPVNLKYPENFGEHRKNFADADGNSILHEAVYRMNDPTLFKFYFSELKKEKLNINIKNSLGETALHHAVVHWRDDLIEPLLSLGANINAKDNNGFTPLNVAQQYGCYEIFLKLKSLGGTLNKDSSVGFVPKRMKLNLTRSGTFSKSTYLPKNLKYNNFRDVNKLDKHELSNYFNYMDYFLSINKLVIKDMENNLELEGKIHGIKELRVDIKKFRKISKMDQRFNKALERINEKFSITNGMSFIGVTYQGEIYEIKYGGTEFNFSEKLVYVDKRRSCNKQKKWKRCDELKILIWNNDYVIYDRSKFVILDSNYQEKFLKKVEGVKEVVVAGKYLVLSTEDNNIYIYDNNLKKVDELNLEFHKVNSFNNIKYSDGVLFGSDYMSSSRTPEKSKFPGISTIKISSKGELNSIKTFHDYSDEAPDLFWFKDEKWNIINTDLCRFAFCSGGSRIEFQQRELDGKLIKSNKNPRVINSYRLVRQLKDNVFLLASDKDLSKRYIGKISLDSDNITIENASRLEELDASLVNINVINIGPYLILIDSLKLFVYDMASEKVIIGKDNSGRMLFETGNSRNYGKTYTQIIPFEKLKNSFIYKEESSSYKGVINKLRNYLQKMF